MVKAPFAMYGDTQMGDAKKGELGMSFAAELPLDPEYFANEIYIASRFLRFMVNARQYWHGDLDRHLISMCFLVIKYSNPVRKISLDGDQKSLSIQSIADMTGIPRESVRRKVDVMIKMGDLSVDSQGLLVANESAMGADVVKEILGYLTKIE